MVSMAQIKILQNDWIAIVGKIERVCSLMGYIMMKQPSKEGCFFV
ncbi:MAG: hypothetical protein PWP51_2731, partial [Clostridiales bacterium]|nr:hypothetical protein [Clostridiales bacterium]